MPITPIVAEQHVVAQGTPVSLLENQNLLVKPFLYGIADGPVPFNVPAEDYQIIRPSY